MSKNFKHYLDIFKVQYYEKHPYNLYNIGNSFKTYYADKTSYRDARYSRLRIPEFKIERMNPVMRSSMSDQIEQLNLNLNKSYKLGREIEDYEYTIGQIKDTRIHSAFFPLCKYASLGDIVFENDIAKEITYKFVIYDDYMTYDASLQRIAKLMEKPIR